MSSCVYELAGPSRHVRAFVPRTHTVRGASPRVSNRARSGASGLGCRRLHPRASAGSPGPEESRASFEQKVEATTQKFGLEAGLWQVLTSKGGEGEGRPKKGAAAKELLARYGSAYLITSISLSLVSFGMFYVLVSSGVDVAALLRQVGLEVSATSEKVGTVALAYAAHKAASPIRFPPTVALTPVVARALGKEIPDDISDNPK
eukprot:CAMPEP_0114256626 /NCGR_PEP_ID=MMETSP0058-20121206/18271_1 /TAXON_ID=36894 /ORGANISM="Pyramimonas parkeae, CCMP726" /LENGTH=203 /DNA_ID=CAMNT_0001371241 /DNA_START=81 /DNA_END=692 /DNA_ORIENTATION=-